MIRRKRKTSKPIPTGKSKPFNRVPVGLISAVIFTLILGGIPFGFGKYIEFHSPGPFDSGAYVYSAEHLLQGASLGVDEVSSSRPGTLLANIIGVKLFGFNDLGPKAVQMTLQLSAFVFMFYALRKVFGSAAAAVGTTVAAIYLSAPLIAKFGNVKEQFMIPFMIAAACCFLLYGISQKRYWLIAAGFFAIQPYYFKPTGLSIVIALVLYLTLGNVLFRKWKALILELSLFLSGYIIGLLIPESLYLWQDMPAAILDTLPVVLLEVGFIFAAIVIGIIIIIGFFKKVHLLRKLRQVSKWIWITGLCLIFITFILSAWIIKIEPGSENSDIISYTQDISLIRIPRRILETPINKLMASSGLRGGYVSNSWKAVNFSTLAPRIFRYYKALSVPILLAIGSIIVAGCIWLPKLLKKNMPADVQSKLVYLLVLWWVLDMLFVWGSPRSYEQYYLPLCASGAMLSGFLVWKWQENLFSTTNKIPWLLGGLIAVIMLGYLAIPIFIGQRYSPDTGSDYFKNNGHRRRGFRPALKELPSRQKGAWVAVGDYIRTNSTEKDTIYVWGWYPGIYVQAQRLSPVPNAFEGDMHIKSPRQLQIEIHNIIKSIKKEPPKFIVDSRKIHFPNDRPPLELWPHVYSKQKPFGEPIPNNPQVILQYDEQYKKMLAEQFDPRQKEYASLPGLTCWLQYAPWSKAMPDEARRYEVMKPLRDLVMNNYRIAGQYGIHIVFERK